MKILTFDDKPDVSYYFEEYFDDGKYDFTTCGTCSDVIQELDDGCFDCYIVDLNTSTLGLRDEIQLKTKSGLLTGWFLLTEYIWKKDPGGIPKTIIFSDYITQLKRYLSSVEASEDEKKKFEQLEKYRGVVHKSDGFTELENAIGLINQRNRGK